MPTDSAVLGADSPSGAPLLCCVGEPLKRRWMLRRALHGPKSQMPFPVAEQFIATTERKLGVSFPPGFRAHMSSQNGGILSTDDGDWQLFPFFDPSDRKHLSRTCNDIVHETITAREWRDFPPEAIAIADNGSGDYLVFLPLPDSTMLQTRPFIWLHESGELVDTNILFENTDSKPS
jgi:hypothetical protein